jgi:hypothetical protein
LAGLTVSLAVIVTLWLCDDVRVSVEVSLLGKTGFSCVDAFCLSRLRSEGTTAFPWIVAYLRQRNKVHDYDGEIENSLLNLLAADTSGDGASALHDLFWISDRNGSRIVLDKLVNMRCMPAVLQVVQLYLQLMRHRFPSSGDFDSDLTRALSLDSIMNLVADAPERATLSSASPALPNSLFQSSQEISRRQDMRERYWRRWLVNNMDTSYGDLMLTAISEAESGNPRVFHLNSYALLACRNLAEINEVGVVERLAGWLACNRQVWVPDRLFYAQCLARLAGVEQPLPPECDPLLDCNASIRGSWWKDISNEHAGQEFQRVLRHVGVLSDQRRNHGK